MSLSNECTITWSDQPPPQANPQDKLDEPELVFRPHLQAFHSIERRATIIGTTAYN